MDMITCYMIKRLHDITHVLNIINTSGQGFKRWLEEAFSSPDLLHRLHAAWWKENDRDIDRCDHWSYIYQSWSYIIYYWKKIWSYIFWFGYYRDILTPSPLTWIFVIQTKKYFSLKQRNNSHSLTKSHLTLPREWVKTVMFPEMMPVVELPIDKLSRSAPLERECRRTQTFTWGRNTSDSTEKYFSLKEEIPINWFSSRSIFIWPRQGTE